MDYAIFEKLEGNIHYIKFSPELPTIEDFDNYLAKLTKVIYNFKEVYFIMDASYAPYIPSGLRKKQANWIKEHQVQLMNNVISTVYIIPNAIQRSILNAIYLIQKPASPYKIVSTYKYALDYLLEIKEKRSVA